MVNVPANAPDHASVLTDHEDALTRVNAITTANIVTTIAIITANVRVQGNAITGERRSIMMTDTNIGSLNPDENVAESERNAIVVNIAKRNANDLGIKE